MHTPGRFILAALILVTASPCARAVNVPLSHPVYEFLQRAEIRGWLDEPLSGARPYTREQIARRLASIGTHAGELSAVERDQLHYYAFQYQDEFDALDSDVDDKYGSYWSEQRWLPDWLFPNGLDAVHVRGEDEDWSVSVNPSAAVEYYELPPAAIGGGEDNAHRVIGSGGALRFRYDRWSAAGALTDSHVRHTGVAADSVRYPYNSGPVGGSANSLDFYDAAAQIAYQSGHIHLWFGHGEQRWAEGESGSLQINDYAKPYTHFFARIRFFPFELTTVQAKLQTMPRIIESTDTLQQDVIRSNPAKKWMAAHRFEYYHRKWLRVGFFQQVFYGRREIDVEYLNPLMFVMAKEYYNGDTDNVLIGADFRVIMLDRLSIYGQVLFDEFILSRLFDTDYTNKWAFLVGFRLMDPISIPNSVAWGEYARIRPYVYTHKFPINRATHLGAPLGHALAPNSDQLSFGWRQRFSHALSAELQLQYTRHGANPPGENVGGDIDSPATENGRLDRLALLSGDLEETVAVGVGLTAEPVLHLRVGVSASYLVRSFTPEQGAGREDNPFLLRAAVHWYPLF